MKLPAGAGICQMQCSLQDAGQSVTPEQCQLASQRSLKSRQTIVTDTFFLAQYGSFPAEVTKYILLVSQ